MAYKFGYYLVRTVYAAVGVDGGLGLLLIFTIFATFIL